MVAVESALAVRTVEPDVETFPTEVDRPSFREKKGLELIKYFRESFRSPILVCRVL